MKKLLAGLTTAVLIFGFAITGACVTEPISDHSVMVYGSISLHDGLNMSKFLKKEHKEVEIVINTWGGMASQLLTMVYAVENAKERGIKIITHATGDCMSAGAVLFMLGDERIAHENTLFMFHKTRVLDAFKNIIPRKDLQPHQILAMDLIDNVQRRILAEFLNKEKIELLMQDDDLYMSGIDAYKMGLVTKLLK